MVSELVILARRVQPAAFALTLACLTMGLNWTSLDIIHGPYEQILGALCLMVTVALFIGWVINSWAVMRWSLLAATFVWLYITWVTTMVAFSTWVNTGLALSWAALAGGSYWLEERDYAAEKALSRSP
jgi:hypothetical protein